MSEPKFEDLPIAFTLSSSNKAIFIYAAVGAAVGAAIGFGIYKNENFWKKRLIQGINLALEAERKSPNGLV